MAGVVQVSENMALAADVDLLGKRQNATEMAVGGVLNLAHRVTLIEGEVMVVKRGIDILARGENLIFQKLEK